MSRFNTPVCHLVRTMKTHEKFDTLDSCAAVTATLSMATSSPRADVAASRRAEKDALEREHHTRYMLSQLQQSHDALRLSTASSSATVETLQAELSSAEAQSDASRREVEKLQAELQATRQTRASSPLRISIA